MMKDKNLPNYNVTKNSFQMAWDFVKSTAFLLFTILILLGLIYFLVNYIDVGIGEFNSSNSSVVFNQTVVFYPVFNITQTCDCNDEGFRDLVEQRYAMLAFLLEEQGYKVDRLLKVKSYDDFSFLQEAALRFAWAHNYSGKYNCVNYAEDFEETMEALGIQAEYVEGRPAGYNHAFNEVCFALEPQTGGLVEVR